MTTVPACDTSVRPDASDLWLGRSHLGCGFLDTMPWCCSSVLIATVVSYVQNAPLMWNAESLRPSVGMMAKCQLRSQLNRQLILLREDSDPYTLEAIKEDPDNPDNDRFKFSHDVIMARKPDDDNKIKSAQLAFGWMACNYDDIAYWFEPWEFIRKLVLTMVAVLAAEEATIQIVWALIACTLSETLEPTFLPF